tara:strand:- start:69369 stop:70610 length:1242 start_codon:yes stop_codon:yes gene_type:complete
MMPLDRRSFLATAGAVPLGLGLSGSGFFVPRGDERTVLVLELEGGNDGLNTVVPVGDEIYAKRRPALSQVRKGSHRLLDGTALHPSLLRLHKLVGEGHATVLHGVGYPQPDRSHFRSRDIWHVADPTHQRVAAGTTGWLGRAADLLAAKAQGADEGGATGVPAAAVGSLQVPLVLKARTATVPSLRRVEDFQWLGADRRGAIPADHPTRDVLGAVDEDKGSDLRRFITKRAKRAVTMADSLSKALARYVPATEYPDTALGRHLRLVAQLVVTGFGTRLLHVPFGGFDTHARQLPTHSGLLRQLDAALGAFVKDLQHHGKWQSVVVLVHSEFGRRVTENASQGTDHGAAGPAFVLGGKSIGGTVGAVPDLGELVDGDLVATMDFRRIYADLLRWFGVDHKAVLGGAFASAGLWA